jgi:hypothetical protein
MSRKKSTMSRSGADLPERGVELRRLEVALSQNQELSSAKVPGTPVARHGLP